jgi:predicted RNase H-like nuclease (RuvC/YqgF family)
MREQLEQRICQLKQELQSGQQMFDDLETRRAYLRNKLLRISGAVQALEEILTESGPEAIGE